MKRTKSALGAVALTTLAVAACGGSGGKPHSLHISASSFHGTWPFTVSSGVVACRHPPHSGPFGVVTFTAPDGTTYGINGTALDHGYPDVTPIWRKPAHPLVPGERVSIGDVQDRGLQLC